MNFWGFTPAVFDDCEKIFDAFIHEAVKKDPMKCEHVIPTAIGQLIDEGKVTVKMLSSSDKWFGVTYQQDKPGVVAKIQAMNDAGIYPDVLWK